MNGRVKFFNLEKKWGFITGANGEEYFAHWSDIQKPGYKSLKKNQTVEFDTEKTDRGWKAVNIFPKASA